jgi:glucose/arabinose dehydrogenase
VTMLRPISTSRRSRQCDLPKDEAHGWKFIAIGPDNKLYLEVGQPGNNVLHDKDPRSAVSILTVPALK